MSLRDEVLSGLRWTAGFRFLAQAFTWIATILVIRMLDPSDYGLMALAGVFISSFALINEMGLGTAVIQRRDLQQDELKVIFGFLLAISAVICLLLFATAPLIASYYDEPDLGPIIWILSTVFVFSAFSVMPRSLLLRDLHYKSVEKVNFAGAIAGALCTLAMAIMGKGV